LKTTKRRFCFDRHLIELFYKVPIRFWLRIGLGV